MTTHDAAFLPRQLGCLLERQAGRCHTRRYPDLEAAVASLSAACVAFGREQAGLPALAPPPA